MPARRLLAALHELSEAFQAAGIRAEDASIMIRRPQYRLLAGLLAPQFGPQSSEPPPDLTIAGLSIAPVNGRVEAAAPVVAEPAVLSRPPDQ